MERGGGKAPQQHGAYLIVGRRIWPHSLALVLIYAITLSIFPGFLAEDVSSAKLSDWYPVILITTFNFADLAGKELPGWGFFPHPSISTMVSGAVVRLMFIPAFYSAGHWGGGPIVMGCLTLLLGITNGYLSSVLMMACPRGLKGMHAELAGNFSILSLVIGLCIGAACSFLWLLQ